ncbi:uncharacterized protein EI90DRAFT_3125182 [Cantharellus anzutake]|uniref:uncharacterized protein n=1 Tax=Cantharellus anzutake TaxID=1750568 RepID=UPI0019060B31|nr:uncharacterized protein EI90DRAFT_3125182 [Cantharellus anzutake]KAF8329400.1 hypothetical protein EI90DRAFT_3125182 [Cantharellus anzutake]
MDVVDVAQRLKLAFETPPRGSVSDAIALVSASVREFNADPSQSHPQWLAPLEVKLLDVYENHVPHNSVKHLEGFLSVLFTLKTVLPASSIISWFDHLRTALREPRLSIDAGKGLREMLSFALKDHAHSAESRSREFRRRLLELYLFDASPAAESSEGVIESLNQKVEDREARKTWEENLERILASDVVSSPNDSFAVLNSMFTNPAARPGITTILHRVFSNTRSPPVSEFSKSPLLQAFFTSLLVDRSDALFDQEISALISIMPHMAVRCPESLRDCLGSLLVLLARAVCWKQPNDSSNPNRSEGTEESDNDNLGPDKGNNKNPEHARAVFRHRNDEDLPHDNLQDYNELVLKPELNWDRLGPSTSDPSTIIDASRYFTFIYGIYPCNTIAFLRRPVVHLQEVGYDSPFAVPWRDILDVDEIRSRSKRIVRNHAIHPGILYRDAPSELSSPLSYTTGRSDIDDVAMVVADCARLDQSRVELDVEEMLQSSTSREGYSPRILPVRESHKNTPRAREFDRLQPLDIFNTRKSSISEHRSSFVDSPPNASGAHTPLIFSSPNLLASTSFTSLLDRTGSSPTTQNTIPPLPQPSPLTLSTLPLPDVEEDVSSSSSIEKYHSQDVRPDPPPRREATEQAVIFLQRENAQLREMCNFSAWLKDQMKHHVNRLHKDRVLAKCEESERQGLHNRLREYRHRLEASTTEISKLKEQALRAQKANRDWVTILNDKINGFRKEKASWLEEAVNLRGQITDAQNTVKAQSALLAEAQRKVVDLTNQIHFLNPKAEQLSKYERRIEELCKQVNLEESEEIKQLKADLKALHEARHQIMNMKSLIGSLEHANKELEVMLSERTSELKRLEQRLANPPRSPRPSNAKTPSPRFRPVSISSSPLRPQPPLSPDTESKLSKLETENAELKEDVEALKVMVETLRADGERARIREANKARRQSISVSRSPRFGPTKGTPSAAEVSRGGEITPEMSVPPLSLDDR